MYVSGMMILKQTQKHTHSLTHSLTPCRVGRCSCEMDGWDRNYAMLCDAMRCEDPQPQGGSCFSTTVLIYSHYCTKLFQVSDTFFYSTIMVYIVRNGLLRIHDGNSYILQPCIVGRQVLYRTVCYSST